MNSPEHDTWGGGGGTLNGAEGERAAGTRGSSTAGSGRWRRRARTCPGSARRRTRRRVVFHVEITGPNTEPTENDISYWMYSYSRNLR